MTQSIKILFSLILIISLTSCAGVITHWEGKRDFEDGNIETGIEKLKKATQEAPHNPEYRLSYLKSRETAIVLWIDQVEKYRREGNISEATRITEKILHLEPDNARTKEILNAIRQDIYHKETLKKADDAIKAGEHEEAQFNLREILTQNPNSDPALTMSRSLRTSTSKSFGRQNLNFPQGLRQTLSLEFIDAPIRQVFEVFSKTSELNFIFDKEVPQDQKTTVHLKNASIDDAINLILMTGQLEKRIINENTILIYPNTPIKTREYQELVLKSFFLSSSDAKAVGNTLKSILKTKDLIIDEQQNMLIIRDTPEAVRIAEKLVLLHEQPQPEVMLDVEILEVKRTSLMNLGIQWPGQLSMSPLSSSSGGPLTLADLKNLHYNQIGTTLDPAIIKANKTDGDANILANPRIRVRAKETAKIMVGERLPNITTTATSTGFISENIQYIDVGLKLEVQPTISPDNEVAIKLALEVSSVGQQITTKAGSTAYQIGTRNTSTVLRLKNGETQILAGLINDEERSSANKIPGLGDIPILGRLFGNRTNDGQKTEIILSITPRIIRNVAIPPLIDTEFDGGTESSFKIVRTQHSPPLQQTQSTTQPQPIANELPSSSSVSASSANPEITWQGPTEVKVGENFSLFLNLQSEQHIIELPCTIQYENDIFEITSVTQGELMVKDGSTTNFSTRIDREHGVIYSEENRAEKKGIRASGNFLKINLIALKSTDRAPISVINLRAMTTNGSPLEISPLPVKEIKVLAK